MQPNTKHIMFDVDGTLIESFEFDEQCFIDAVNKVTNIDINNNWASYPNVTDRGLLMTFIEQQAPDYTLSELEPMVKAQFIINIKEHIDKEPAREVSGAKAFFNYLTSSENHLVSIATGGWGETAKLKLVSAGFDIGDVPIASSNHHHQRDKIMQSSREMASPQHNLKLSYFGDADWDVRTCKDLDLNLIIVGSRTAHHQRIDDFTDQELALSYT